MSFIYTLYLFVESILKKYNYNILYYDIEALDDSKVHVFNIIVQKNNDNDGKYLLFYSKTWKCKLFPNYKSVSKYKKGREPTQEDIENICLLYSMNTGINITKNDLQYKGELSDLKHSENDKVNKHYIFRFFLAEPKPNYYMSDTKFQYDGRKHYWMTIPNMLKDRNIIKKNKKVVDYVKSFTSIS